MAETGPTIGFPFGLHALDVQKALDVISSGIADGTIIPQSMTIADERSHDFGMKTFTLVYAQKDTSTP